MKSGVHQSRRKKREGGSTNDSRHELDASGERRDLRQVVRIAVQSVGDEPDHRPTHAEIEQDEIFSDAPGEANEPKPRWTQVSRRHWHNEEGMGERNREPKKVEKSVVGNARLNRALGR